MNDERSMHELARELRRNTEMVALALLLRDAPKCAHRATDARGWSRADCLQLATVDYEMRGIRAGIDVCEPMDPVCDRHREDLGKDFPPGAHVANERDVPHARQVRRFYALLRGEVL